MDLPTIVTAIVMPVGGVALTLAGKWILAGQKDIKEDIATLQTGLDKRVTVLESDNRQWMPKTDLTMAFDHEKKNRAAADQAAAHLIERNSEDIIRLREHVARLDQNDTYLTGQMNDLRVSMDKSFAKTDAKLDKLCDSVAALDKKVA